MGQFDKLKDEEIIGADVEKTGSLSENNEAVKSVDVPNAEEIKVKEEAKDKNKIETDSRIKELQQELTGKVESKEGYPEGHIMNSNMLDKIAQLEAINPDTSEFDQDRYNNYMNGQSKLGSYSVGENQKIIKEKIQKGKSLEKALLSTEIIYGDGGWNRYRIDPLTGVIKLLRGVSNTSGSEGYKTKLAQKAKELGIMVEGR